jgi:hypothetical protein
MKLTLNLPVLMSAKPAGSRNVRDIHLVSRREYDVAEYSLKDCEVAYSVSEADNDNLSISSVFPLLAISGRLYRQVAPIQLAIDEFFTHPFTSTINSQFASLDINLQFEGRLILQQQLGLRSRKTWPPPSRGGDSRNETSLEDVIGTFDEISPAEYGEALLTTARVATGLAVIDGTLWSETPPPCISVSLTELYPGTHHVFKTMDFASDVPAFHYGVTNRRYALDNAEEADVYARELFEMTGKKNTSTANAPLPMISRHVNEADLNDGYEHIRRISRDLSYSCVTTAFKKPELVKNLSQEQHDLLEQCKAHLLGENYLLGERFDIVEPSLELLEIWRQLGRPKPGQVLQLTPATLLDAYLERTLEDCSPIRCVPRATPLTP